MAQSIPAFHVLSAELALKAGRMDEAASHFRQAAQLEPSNPLHRLNLSAIELQSTEPSVVEGARFNLMQLSQDSHFGAFALRWRVVDELRLGNQPDAETLSRQLLAHPRAVLDDRLKHLEVLQLAFPKDAARKEFEETLHSIQLREQTNAVSFYRVCEWMGSHGLADEALGWLRGVEPKILAAHTARLAWANLYVAKNDWAALENFLIKEQWTDLDFLRLALLARAAWGQGHELAGKGLWDNAMNAAAGRLGPSTLLLGLANDWGRDPGQLLWQIGRRFPKEQWALLELERRDAVLGDTRGLNKIYGARMESRNAAADFTNRNNFATTSLLLGANLARAHEIARELYGRQPNDPIIASTYAYSLHLQRRTREGLRALEALSRESLESPPVALYYGVLLTADGQVEKADGYLNRTEQGNLLPEEKSLLRRARELTQGR